MKNRTRTILMVFSCLVMNMQAQITLNACNAIIENQDYTFNAKMDPDPTGRNVFETDPITGDQDCGGIGVCELQISWNDGLSRWEILADDGNGNFVNTYVLYHNTEASTPNPPSLLLGTWEENTAVTGSLCIDGIMTLSGDVQDTTLSQSGIGSDLQLLVYPNPASDIIYIKTNGLAVQAIKMTDISGRAVMSVQGNREHLEVSGLSRGIYFLNIETEGARMIKKIVIE